MSKNVVKQIDRLSLDYKTFLTGFKRSPDGEIELETRTGALREGLDISLWDEDLKYKWVIASFEKNEKENLWELHELGNRLLDVPYWAIFGALVAYGHSLLDNLLTETDPCDE